MSRKVKETANAQVEEELVKPLFLFLILESVLYVWLAEVQAGN